MRRTATTIERATDLAYEQPGTVIRVRRTWSVEVAQGEVFVRHYGTLVLRVNPDDVPELGPRACGSVSDQGGVNRVLAHLGLSARASRVGGNFQLRSTENIGLRPLVYGYEPGSPESDRLIGDGR